MLLQQQLAAIVPGAVCSCVLRMTLERSRQQRTAVAVTAVTAVIVLVRGVQHAQCWLCIVFRCVGLSFAYLSSALLAFAVVGVAPVLGCPGNHVLGAVCGWPRLVSMRTAAQLDTEVLTAACYAFALHPLLTWH